MVSSGLYWAEGGMLEASWARGVGVGCMLAETVLRGVGILNREMQQGLNPPLYSQSAEVPGGASVLALVSKNNWTLTWPSGVEVSKALAPMLSKNHRHVLPQRFSSE